MALKDLISGGIEGIVESVANVADRFITTGDEKNQMKLDVARVVNERMAILQNQIIERFNLVRGVIESEMKHGNSYTKNARPTIVYAGLLIHMVNAFGQMFGLEKIEIDPNFTYVWGGVCGVWIVGRSAEKVGASNKATAAITGNRSAAIDL